MRSLYESLLDDQENILNASDKVASSRFKDKMIVFNLYIGTSDYSSINIVEFIDWKKFSKEVRYKIQNDNWKLDNRFSDPVAASLECAFENQPLLGYEQNFLTYIRNFAKGDVLYSYEKVMGKDRYTYTFKGKGHDLEIEFIVKPR